MAATRKFIEPGTINITKSDWAKECLDWIGEYVISGLAKSTAYEIGRFTTTYYSTTGTAIDLIDSTIDAVIDYICGDWIQLWGVNEAGFYYYCDSILF